MLQKLLCLPCQASACIQSFVIDESWIICPWAGADLQASQTLRVLAERVADGAGGLRSNR